MIQTSMAKADVLEFTLKKKGAKYYDRLSECIFSRKPFVIDVEDLDGVITDGSAIEYVIRNLYHIVHLDCEDPHRTHWICGRLTGTILLRNQWS